MAAERSASSRKSKHYRMDIQGLRGIAVLLVVLYHADVAFSGGYIGVDIFFVLSGFVIAQVLYRELQKTGGLDLKRFYEKRFRRLLPAAALCSVVTLVGAVIFLSPTGPQQFAIRTAMAAALFGSNLYLFRGGGYFDSAAEANPFLHMWSLSVEEQFYFVLPVTMALVWMWVVRRNNRHGEASAMNPLPVIMWVVMIGGTLSLALSTALATHPQLFPFDADSFGFYFPLTRVWEFSAGVLLALGAKRLPSLGRRMALLWGLVGGALILYASIAFDGDTAFPGWAALLPIVGTVLLLHAGDTSESVSRVLAWKPLSWMGNISYSWYLWHWPLIVFAPIIFPEAGTWILAVAGFGAIVPAWLSYTYLEEPIRRNRAIVGPAARRLAVACIGMVLIAGAGLSFGASKHWGLNPPPGWSDLPVAFEQPCEGPLEEWDRDKCLFPAPDNAAKSDQPPILLIGDSHTGSLSNGVIEAGNELGYDVMVMWMPSCPLLKDRSVYGDYRCERWQQEMMLFIEEMPLSLIITGVYANNYVLSPHYGRHKFIETEDGRAPDGHDEALASWRGGLEDTLKAFEQNGIPSILAAPVPFYPKDPTLELSLFRSEPLIQEFTREELEQRQASIAEAIKSAESRYPSATLFSPIEHVCDDNHCSPVVEGNWTYLDEGHLNAHGSKRLAPAFKEAIRQALESDRVAKD